ncbi:MAG: hypothetical protein ACHQAQ_09675 [Hyphomicrobiales bacterium]
MLTSDIGLVILLGVVAFIVLTFRARKRAAARLSRYLARSGFIERGDVVPLASLNEDMSSVQVFAGKLKPDLEVRLLFGRRRGGTLIIDKVPVTEIEEYLCIYVPDPKPVPGKDWIARWGADPAARGERPQRIEPTAQGGILFNWRCPIDEKNVAKRLDEIRAAWPNPSKEAAV